MSNIFVQPNCLLLALPALFVAISSASRALLLLNRFGHGVVCNCECGLETKSQGPIVGGVETERNEFPWLTAILYERKFHCGGTLITNRHVLTAAHCLKGYATEKLTILLGEYNLGTPTGEEHSAAAAKFHEDFNAESYYNDVGVIILDEPTEFSNRIRPGCLATTAKEYRGMRGIVAGWGKVGYGMDTSDIALKVDVPIMSREECLKTGYTREQIAPTMLCAGYAHGKKDACSGDSGGPLHVENKQGQLEIVGIVSWGEECAKANYPGVYTKVYDYIDWIIIQLDKNCLCSKPQTSAVHRG